MTVTAAWCRGGTCQAIWLWAVLALGLAISACSADTEIKEEDKIPPPPVAVLLGADRNGDLWLINLATGAATPFAETFTTEGGPAGPVGVVSSMAIVPSIPALFLGTGGSANWCSGCLYLYNYSTGEAANVANLNAQTSGAMPGMALRAGDGQLVTINSSLVSIDPLSYTPNVEGTVTGAGGSGKGITFDLAGNLYISNASTLYSVDQGTFAASLLGTFTYPNAATIDPLFPRTTPVVLAMTTALSGQIYGLVRDGTQTAPTYLAQIDPVTPEATLVGRTKSELDGLAWLPGPPPTPAPGPPQGVFATIGNYSTVVQWNPGILTNKVWDVYWSDTGTMSGLIANATGSALGLTQPRFNHTPVTDSVTYYYMVRARNASGASVVSPEIPHFASVFSIAPTIRSVGPVLNKLWITWDPVPGAQSYGLYFATSTMSGDPLNAQGFYQVTGTSYLHAVPTGTPYYYLVTALTAGNESSPSGELSASIPAAPSYQWTFDNGTLQGWSTSGLWHLSNSFAATNPYAVWFGDPFSGTFDTGFLEIGDLISPLFTVPVTTPVLAFNYHHNGEEADGVVATTYDKLTVYVRPNGGGWSPLVQLPEVENGFAAYQVSLAGYEGLSVQVRFEFDSGDANVNSFEGTYIDNVTIY